VNIKGLLFDFRGDRVYIVSGAKEVASIDLSKYSGEVLSALLKTGEKFISAHGSGYYHLTLDTIAFGYGLLSPQTVNLDVLSRLSATPVLNLADILPPVQRAVGVYGATAKSQFYATKQLLESGVKIETVITRDFVRNLLSTQFREGEFSVIELSPSVASFVRSAQATGAQGISVLLEAAKLAKYSPRWVYLPLCSASP